MNALSDLLRTSQALLKPNSLAIGIQRKKGHVFHWHNGSGSRIVDLLTADLPVLQAVEQLTVTLVTQTVVQKQCPPEM